MSTTNCLQAVATPCLQGRVPDEAKLEKYNTLGFDDGYVPVKSYSEVQSSAAMAGRADYSNASFNNLQALDAEASLKHPLAQLVRAPLRSRAGIHVLGHRHCSGGGVVPSPSYHLKNQ
jgi:hypothetical protein